MGSKQWVDTMIFYRRVSNNIITLFQCLRHGLRVSQSPIGLWERLWRNVVSEESLRPSPVIDMPSYHKLQCHGTNRAGLQSPPESLHQCVPGGSPPDSPKQFQGTLKESSCNANMSHQNDKSNHNEISLIWRAQPELWGYGHPPIWQTYHKGSSVPLFQSLQNQPFDRKESLGWDTVNALGRKNVQIALETAGLKDNEHAENIPGLYTLNTLRCHVPIYLHEVWVAARRPRQRLALMQIEIDPIGSKWGNLWTLSIDSRFPLFGRVWSIGEVRRIGALIFSIHIPGRSLWGNPQSVMFLPDRCSVLNSVVR